MATLDSAAADLLAVSPARSRTANRLAWFYLVLALPLVVLFATIMAPVQVAATSLNHLDVVQRNGWFTMPGYSLPHIAGMDVVKKIETTKTRDDRPVTPVKMIKVTVHD